MLVLSRKAEESIVIDERITITILEVRGNQIRIGIDAPQEVPVIRKELCVRNLAAVTAA
jgi:carbon storage regulator